MSSSQHLVDMANDIGDFFRAQPQRETAIADIANHMKSFWTHRMREKLIAHGDVGLDELPREAIRFLAENPAFKAKQPLDQTVETQPPRTPTVPVVLGNNRTTDSQRPVPPLRLHPGASAPAGHAAQDRTARHDEDGMPAPVTGCAPAPSGPSAEALRP